MLNQQQDEKAYMSPGRSPSTEFMRVLRASTLCLVGQGLTCTQPAIQLQSAQASDRPSGMASHDLICVQQEATKPVLLSGELCWCLFSSTLDLYRRLQDL